MLGVTALAIFLPLATAKTGLIVDTDIGGGACMDVDDVAAVCAANAIADSGKVDLLAIVQNTQPASCTGVISALLHYYGRDDLPIGAYKGDGLDHSGQLSYVDDLARNFPAPIKNSSQVPDAVDVYRSVLAAAPDRSVAISSIGLMTNLELLLRSGPDRHSPLSGTDLVAKKVKVLAAMAGAYPNLHAPGVVAAMAGAYPNQRAPGGVTKECNMCGCYNGADAKSSATAGGSSAYVYSNMPASVKLVFSGFEVGVNVRSGAVLETCAPVSSPCRQAFMDYKRDNSGGWAPRGRCSWDPLTTLVAALGVSDDLGVAECANCSGYNHVDPDGSNHWVPGAATNQSYLVLDDADVAGKAIDALLCQPPRRHARSVVEA